MQSERVDYCQACGDKFAAIGRSRICGLCKARRIAVDQLAHEVMLMKHTIQEMQRVDRCAGGAKEDPWNKKTKRRARRG